MMCRTTYFEIFTGFFSSALFYFEKENGIAAQGYSLKNVVGIFFLHFQVILRFIMNDFLKAIPYTTKCSRHFSRDYYEESL